MRQNIIYYCQCNVNCCSVSHTKDHQQHVQSLSAPHNTTQKKKYSTCLAQVSQKCLKHNNKLHRSHKWRVQNEKKQICKESIQRDRTIAFSRNSWLGWVFLHCTTCLPTSLFKISRVFASLMFVLCKSSEQLVYTRRFNKDFNFATKCISR